MIAGLVISLFLLLPLTDSLSAVQRSYARGEKVRVSEGASAAAYLFGPDATYTGAAASWNYAKDPAPLVREEGRGLSEGQLNIGTLVRLDSLSAVRGKVRYVNGVKRDVLWNSSSDCSTVYPYVMADMVGGDLRKEEYAFSGGYTARRGRFHWGVEGAYRALHEYRQADPRPRNIVSDLSVTGSAGWRPVPGYVLDATLGYRRYSQTQTMSFLNARGKNTSILHLTGLGSQFSRFSGATDANMNTRYAGNGVTVAAAWIPLRENGWNATASYSLLNIIHYLPNQNEVPYTELYTREADIRLQYLSRSGNLAWPPAQTLSFSGGSAGAWRPVPSIPAPKRIIPTPCGSWPIPGSGPAWMPVIAAKAGSGTGKRPSAAACIGPWRERSAFRRNTPMRA